MPRDRADVGRGLQSQGTPERLAAHCQPEALGRRVQPCTTTRHPMSRVGAQDDPGVRPGLSVRRHDHSQQCRPAIRSSTSHTGAGRLGAESSPVGHTPVYRVARPARSTGSGGVPGCGPTSVARRPLNAREAPFMPGSDPGSGPSGRIEPPEPALSAEDARRSGHSTRHVRHVTGGTEVGGRRWPAGRGSAPSDRRRTASASAGRPLTLTHGPHRPADSPARSRQVATAAVARTGQASGPSGSTTPAPRASPAPAQLGQVVNWVGSLGVGHSGATSTPPAASVSARMSMRQPVSFAARRAFWPSLPMARLSW